MQVLSLLWGILAIVGMVVGFFPCLGSLNWLNIPFAGVGIIVSGIALGYGGQQFQKQRYRWLSMLHCGPVFWHHTPRARRGHFLTIAGNVFHQRAGRR